MNGLPNPPLPEGALDALRDIHLPPPISWWPPAPGWWLAALLVPLLIGGLWWWWRAGRLKRAGLKALRELYTQQSTRPDTFVAELSTLLRRCAVVRFPREEAAGCVGREWLAFLDRTGATSDFTEGAGAVLASAPYRPGEAVDVDALKGVAERWLRRALGRRGRWRRV